MKLNLSNITSGYGAVAALNANFDAIEQAVENTLSRDGTTPNEMLANLDMNGNDILNADTINTSSLVINGTPVQPATGVTVASAFQSHSFVATAGQTSFSLAPFTPYSASVQVEVNGLVLPPADISVSGTNVVIPACTAGDEVVIRRYTDAPSPFPNANDITFNQANTVQTRSVQSKLRDVVSVMDFGAQGNGVADDTVALQSALSSSLGMSAPSAVFLTATGNLSPTAKTTIAGAGRENTFFRTSHASNSVFLSTAQFVTYRDMTIDRSGAVAGTGITHNAVSNVAPLEGLELDRVNINGHNFGISIRDLVLGGIRNSYIQAGGTGVDINNTGVNAVASFWMEHVWIRGNTTVGANIINCKQTRLQQVAFESAGGRTCPKGLSVIGGNAVYLGNCWFEALLFGAEFIGCGTVTFDGGYLDGSALTARGFYAANSSGNTTVIFDGPWQVENLSVTFATADDNSTIIVRTPSLAAYTFQAINGGKVIYDFDYVKTQTYNPPSLPANGTTTVNVTVDGASAGDLVTVNFSDGTTDPNLFYWTGTVTGPNTVVVFLRNMHTSTIDLGSGTLTTRVRKRPLTS